VVVVDDHDLTAAELEVLLAGGASPEEINAWAEALDADERALLVQHHADLIGNLDGIPFDLRYAANRLRIQQARDDTAAALDAAQQAGIDTTSLETRLATLDRFIERDGQYLLFSNDGLGRVAEVHGDLGTADHLAVLVPGMSNHLDNFQAFSADAQRLQQRADALDGVSSHTAVIAWLGYEPPQDLVGAALTGHADRGAPALASLVDGLLVPDRVTTSVIAHSYGSVLTGTALRDEGLVVDNVAFIGSPGVRVDRASDFDLPDTDFYAARAPLDGVSYLNRFGLDPSDPRFGARRFTTDPEDGLLYWHSSYFERDSESLQNLAYVAIDRDDAVTTMDPTLHEYVVLGIDEVQRFANGVRDVPHAIVDGVQEHVPLPGPVDLIIDGGQALDDVLVDTANAGVDVGQEVLDRAGDVVDDLGELGDQAAEEVVEHLDPRSWF
jgi:hypothetical protein